MMGLHGAEKGSIIDLVVSAHCTSVTDRRTDRQNFCSKWRIINSITQSLSSVTNNQWQRQKFLHARAQPGTGALVTVALRPR